MSLRFHCGLECSVELLLFGRMHEDGAEVQGFGHLRNVFEVMFLRRIVDVDQGRNARRAWKRRLNDLILLFVDFFIECDSGDVASRVAITLNETLADRIACGGKYDGHCGGRLLTCDDAR